MRKYLGQTAAALALAFTAGALTVSAQTKPAQPPAASNMSQTSAPPPKNSDAKPPSSATPLTPEQAQLQAQVDKLYQLAEDLKAAVAKSNKDTLSIDVIKKADAVEKAAKGLNDQMKNSQQTANHH